MRIGWCCHLWKELHYFPLKLDIISNAREPQFQIPFSPPISIWDGHFIFHLNQREPIELPREFIITVISTDLSMDRTLAMYMEIPGSFDEVLWLKATIKNPWRYNNIIVQFTPQFIKSEHKPTLRSLQRVPTLILWEMIGRNRRTLWDLSEYGRGAMEFIPS